VTGVAIITDHIYNAIALAAAKLEDAMIIALMDLAELCHHARVQVAAKIREMQEKGVVASVHKYTLTLAESTHKSAAHAVDLINLKVQLVKVTINGCMVGMLKQLISSLSRLLDAFETKRGHTDEAETMEDLEKPKIKKSGPTHREAAEPGWVTVRGQS